MQGERPVIAEAIQRSSPRDRAHEMPVLALIEERAGLLTRPRCRKKLYSVFVHLDLSWDVAVEHYCLPRQSLLRAQRYVVARKNPGRFDERAQRRKDFFPEALQSSAHELDDEPLVVPIADERRTAVGFSVHDPQRVGVILQRNPPGYGRRDALVPPSLLDHSIGIAIQQAQRDFVPRPPHT